jgi:SAM-dependent methyltransferase
MSLIRNLLKSLTLRDAAPESGFSGNAHIYQIFYDKETLEGSDPGFIPLDNTNSERPDWYEYWPIRRHLLGATLNEKDIYGYFSPRFHQKTHLSSDDVFRFIETQPDADIYLFSPFPCHSALFLNIFEQHAYCTRDGLDDARVVWEKLGLNSNFEQVINHSGNTVFSNFFVAKPRFWRAWLEICERMFDCAESGDIEQLVKSVVYSKEDGSVSDVQSKVFLIERVASYILATDPSFKVISYPSAGIPLSLLGKSVEIHLPRLNALKLEMAEQLTAELLPSYRELQKQCFAIAEAQPQGLASTNKGSYYDNVNLELFRHVLPSAKSVCEFGCGAGGFARAVRAKIPNVFYAGIELVAHELDKANDTLDLAICCDLNSHSVFEANGALAKGLNGKQFDHLIFGDVLEHLVSPERALEFSLGFLRPGGTALFCIPNVQHWSVFANLALGTWPRVESGLFDKTHLRWFTLDDMQSLVQAHGLTVESVEKRVFFDERARDVLESLEPLARLLQVDPAQLLERGDALQYILVGKKPVGDPG